MNDSNLWPDDEWLASGDSQVEQEFWATYAKPLHRVADRQLSQQMKRRVDPDDVVQSACRTFFRRVRQGEFSLEDRGDLWRLLLTITLNKARMQARHHGRDCRSIDREQAFPTEPGSDGASFESELEKVDFADFLDSIMRKFDPEQQEILQRSLDNQTQDEIAEAVGCSQRTVRRMQVRIRELLQAILETELNSNE